MLTFEERLLKARNEIRVRVLTKRLYDAIDRLNDAFAEIDAAKKGLTFVDGERGNEKKNL